MTTKDEIERAHAETVDAYDEEAEATEWLGPEIVFGLIYKYIRPDQNILDIGIGTGLGSVLFHKAGLHVYGMDISEEMLEYCKKKNFTTKLIKHDLAKIPYPFLRNAIDHAICTGVMNFFSDLSPIFTEVSRILKADGTFSFIVGDRKPGEEPEFKVGSEHTRSGRSITMYRHGSDQISGYMNRYGFTLRHSLEFPVFMDREKSRMLPALAYVIQKQSQ